MLITVKWSELKERGTSFCGGELCGKANRGDVGNLAMLSNASLKTRVGLSEHWNGDGRNVCSWNDIRSLALLRVRGMPESVYVPDYLSLTFLPCVLLSAKGLACSTYSEKDTSLSHNHCSSCCVLSMYIKEKHVSHQCCHYIDAYAANIAASKLLAFVFST